MSLATNCTLCKKPEISKETLFKVLFKASGSKYRKRKYVMHWCGPLRTNVTHAIEAALMKNTILRFGRPPLLRDTLISKRFLMINFYSQIGKPQKLENTLVISKPTYAWYTYNWKLNQREKIIFFLFDKKKEIFVMLCLDLSVVKTILSL